MKKVRIIEKNGIQYVVMPYQEFLDYYIYLESPKNQETIKTFNQTQYNRR